MRYSKQINDHVRICKRNDTEDQENRAKKNKGTRKSQRRKHHRNSVKKNLDHHKKRKRRGWDSRDVLKLKVRPEELARRAKLKRVLSVLILRKEIWWQRPCAATHVFSLVF